MLQPVVHLGVLAHDLALVPGLLYPLDRAISSPGHGAGKSSRTGSSGHEHWIRAPPDGVDGGAAVQSSHVHVDGSGRGFSRHHGVARGGVKGYTLMGYRNQARGRPLPLLGLGDRLLPESDLRAGNEEQVVHPTQLHGGYHGVGPLVGPILAPACLVVSQTCLSHRSSALLNVYPGKLGVVQPHTGGGARGHDLVQSGEVVLG